MVRLNPGYLELSQDEIDWLVAIAKMNGESNKAVIVNAWRGHLCRHKAHYVKKVRYLAAQHGLTLEECFRRLVEGEDLGKVVRVAPISVMEEVEANTFFGATEEPEQFKDKQKET